MFKTAVARSGLSPRMLSRSLEDTATMTSPLIPWTGCGAFQANALGVPTLEYLPYCFLNYLNPLVAILMTYLGIGIYWGKNGEDRGGETDRPLLRLRRGNPGRLIPPFPPSGGVPSSGALPCPDGSSSPEPPGLFPIPERPPPDPGRKGRLP